MHSLQWMDLSGTAMTDRGLAQLSGKTVLH